MIDDGRAACYTAVTMRHLQRGMKRRGLHLDRTGSAASGDVGGGSRAAVPRDCPGAVRRSEQRRVGKEWLSPGRSRGSPDLAKKNRYQENVVQEIVKKDLRK